MKNFLRVTMLAICAIFMVANVSAQVITAERASEIANQFFANGKQKSAAFRSTSATLTQSVDSRAVTGESNDAPTFHILTGADGKGFVIVSGEETENPIIGYSLDGTIDTNNLPDGFVDYMTDIDAQVRALREYNAANPQKAAARSAMQKAANFEYNANTMGNIVKNLNTAPWGQHGPFNNLCKTTDGQTALTGCGPTAFAILCYYHKWPASGVGTVTHQGTGENMELGHTYDYASMRNDDYRSGYTEAEANAVAVLMRDLGWACEVGYGTGSTSYGETSRHLTEHFYYKDIRTANSNSGATYRNDDEEWKRLIKESLDKEYPIPYSSTTGGTLRHIYILDGYTDNDYYHFNWGWSGQGNGWFTLDNMVPDDYSNYSNSHRAYFNLIPDKTTYTVTATVNDSNMGTVSINGGTAGSTATADFFSGATATLTAHPTQGYALASWTKNGVVVGSRNTIQVTVGTDANDYVANFDNEANVTIVKDYTISSTTGELTNDGTSATKFSQWASNEEPVLKLNATCGKTVANSMSVVDNVLQLYAYDYDKANGYTYTINAPDGYLITSYSLTYYMSSSFNITVSNETTTQTASRSDQTLSASGLSKESASFTLTGAAANNLVKVRSFTVTIQKEGANVPSTPTTYTINVNAETGGNAYVNGTNTSATVDAGTDVTLQAYPDGTNYTFAGWYNGNSFVSSNNPYTFALNSDVTYTAKFNAVATTYTVTTTANPAAGGTAKFAVGTGSQQTQGNVNNGEQITLYATANTGYNFVNWTLGGNVVSTDATCNVSVAQASSYVANFEAIQQPGDGEFPLAGKYFRLKVYNDGRYMNVKNHTEHSQKVSAGGVNVAAKVEDSNAQIFFFEQSGNGYMLKDGDGYYIKGLEWSVDASSTTSGSVLLFEETAIEDVYYIKWNNTYKGDERYFKVGADSNGAGDHPYCDVAANQKETAAAKWVLEEVIPSLTVTFAGASWVNEASSWWEYIVTNQTPAVTVKAANSAKAIGYSTVSSVRHPYLLDGNSFTISLPANCKIVGYTLRYKGHNLNTKTFTYTGNNGTTATETVGQDGVEKTLTVTGLENNEIAISVSDQSSQAGVVIVALEITYIENEFTPLPFKADIENWRNNNPNTHLGTITIGGTPMKLTPEHLTASELTMPVVEGTTLAFTRKYRGFEFQGFYIGATELGTNPTLTAENVAAIDENNPLIAKFTATDDVTLFYDDDTYSYRIPAIVKTVKDDKHKLIAISDYRHSFDDIGRDNHKTGTTQVDLVIRTSEDNGATWTAKQTIAEGSQHFGYGDAAAVANGQDVLVMAVAGNVFYAYANSENPQQAYRIYSNDNGVTWEKEDISNNMESLFPDYHGLFFGSGKLAVDPDFNGSGNARVYGAILMKDSQGERNYVLYSDNWGKTWNILGNAVAARQNEPKVEILPNGQILLSARRGGGRTFNVFTYTDKANNAGTWSTVTNGCDNGGNSTNGEIICLDAKKLNGKPTKILLQSQPYGSDRRNVSIWYKEISANETYTASSIASDWTMGKQVSTQLSAYSAMCLQANGEIALFFEEAPCYGDDHTKGYSMVYVPLTIEEATDGAFLNPNADVEYVPVEFNIVLTDTQDNEYRETLDYIPNDAAAVATYLTTTYPFITLGENGAIADNTYTNTVTLPFKVSNANTTVWHNIYWPANTNENLYPIYMLANSATDTQVAKVTTSTQYGNSQYNTLEYADKLSWAIYSVDGTLNFKLKNKVTQKYIKVTSIGTGNEKNAVYAEDGEATAFTLQEGTGSRENSYTLIAKVNGTTGYFCSTSTDNSWATHYNGSKGNDHHGAWVKFVEAPDYQAIVDALTENIAKFGAGNGNYTDNNDINAIKAIIENIGTTPLNTLNTHTTTVQTVKDSYSEITLTVPAVNDVVPGSVKILGEEVSHKFVPKGEITIQAIPAAGYRFVNWTRPAAQASAAARTAEARNSNVVSDQNPYTVTVGEALSLEANFEEILVNVTLTDAQSNTYNVQLSGFTAEITKETVADKLREAYPYITLGTTDQEGNVIDFGVLNIDGTAYTYTNRIELPFKVSNTTYLWHNIYYPSNNSVGSKPGCPNYIAALNEDEVVDMAASGGYAYGDNPTYNTKDGGNSICWAIYNVNNSFEFIFKSRVTGKYIKVESVVNATGNTQNVKFVENAEDATAFTLLKDAGSYNGDYALVAKVGNATGYLCATSSDMNYVTHFDRNNHQGAWVKFVEAPDYFSMIQDLGIALGYFFGYGDRKCIITGTEIEPIDAALKDNEGSSITLNTLKEYALTIEGAMATWPTIRLSVAPDESGTVTINGEEGVTSKRAPVGHEFPIAAVPAEGYHFVNWKKGDDVLSSNAEHAVTISGEKGEITDIIANFEINTYTVSVTAGEGGSASASAATVEHGSEVTLTATPSSGYSFAGWYDGENLISAEASYTFTVTSHINYTARFNEVPTGTVAIHITVASTDGTTVTNNATGNVKAIINNIGQEWATDADFVVGTDVELVATNDYDQKAYLFDGWYKNGVLVSNDLEITVKATEIATYEARFFRGCVVIGEPKSNRIGYVTKITLPDGTSLGYDASNRAVVKKGTEVMINTWLSYGYETIWKDENDNIVGYEQNLVITIEKDATYTATFEPASYNLTVRANDDNYGTVTAESGTSSGTTIKVGHNMEATITATAKAGYYFVNWTKGTDVVSSENPYTIAGIANVEDMADAEYIANFLPVENATAGVYYRIGYDGFAAAASAGAARAATDETQTYVVSPTTGTPNEAGTFNSSWTYTKNGAYQADLTMVSTSNGTSVNKINTMNNGIQHSLAAYYKVNGVVYGVTYTVSVPENGNYKIAGYSIGYTAYQNVTVNSTATNHNNTGSIQATGLDVYSFDFTVSSTSSSGAIDISNFEVYIQKVDGEGTPDTPEPETPANRYYIQSVACGVSGGNNLQNALEMTKNTTATSIFYYADNKLLSYDKGLYIIENGGTRGLQAVGVSGTVTITTSGETATISAPNYMHANTNGTTYYADHCGSNTGTAAHANHNFVLEEVTTLPVTISSALHATFYAPVAVKIPEGVRAYVLKEKNITANSWVTMTMLQNGIIPANTGVILRSDEAKIYDFIITENTDAARAEAVGNILEGTVAKSYVNKDAYILTKKSNGVGMYPLSNNSYITGGATATFTNNSHKAYLPVEGNFAQLLQQGTGFRFVFDDGTTEIEDVEREVEDTIYDLQGRKLSEITEPGIYIVNGKKVWVK